MFKLSLSSAIRMGAIALALLPAWQLLQAQAYPANYPPAGGYYQRQPASPAERAIDDLRRISERETFSHGQYERYRHAIEHLSEFSGRLYAGKYDRGKLDRGIDDLRNVLQRNRIDPRARDVLSGDLNELYRFRANYGGNRY
jgi:hypothetical protein